jgi:hypothetical protein
LAHRFASGSEKREATGVRVNSAVNRFNCSSVGKISNILLGFRHPKKPFENPNRSDADSGSGRPLGSRTAGGAVR